MTVVTYPAMPYLRRLTAVNGWRHELIRDEHGDPAVLVAVRVGATWTDSVVIEGEDRAVAMRHRTDSDRLIVPAGLSGGSGAVTMCSLSCSSYSAGSGSPWTPAGRGGTTERTSGPVPPPAGHWLSRIPSRLPGGPPVPPAAADARRAAAGSIPPVLDSHLIEPGMTR